MRIALQRKSAIPVYRQIEDAIAKAIRQGSLKTGHPLPSSRGLAQEIGVNRMTVENAYAALEAGGLIERSHGSGTFVLPSFSPQAASAGQDREWPLWQSNLPSPRTVASGAPSDKAPRFNFAQGMGDPQLIPAEKFRRVFQELIRREGSAALGYEPAQGNYALRQAIAEILSSQGLVARPEQVLITSGSQQAISLTAQALLHPGDTVLVEQACYDSALALFRMLGLKIVTLPMDQEGIQVERIEPILQRQRPGLLYCMPNFQNPSACVLSARRRQLLVDLAARYNFPILEDDYVGELRYEGHALPCLRTLDRQGNVLYTSTFSKMLMPGLRLGFLMAEGPVIGHLSTWKQRLEISSPAILQRALHSFVSVGRYRRHVRKARSVYSKRRDAMIASLQAQFPPGTRFETPKGGLFLWLRLPEGVDAGKLRAQAQSAGIAVAWGERFFADGCPEGQWLRLNFAALEIPVIEEGIRLLGKLVGESLERPKQGRRRKA